MKTSIAKLARADLYKMIDSTLEAHEPIQITSKRGNAILMFEMDWRAIQETLDLVSIPGMRESILAGMAEPLGECGRGIDY